MFLVDPLCTHHPFMSPTDLSCSVGSHQGMALGRTFRPRAEGCKQGAGTGAKGLQAPGFLLVGIHTAVGMGSCTLATCMRNAV